MDQSKYRIAVVGTVELIDQVVHVRGWTFRMFMDWLPPGEYDTPLIDGTLAGWTIRELHSIAHGEPCPCGVTQCLTA